MSDRLHPDKGAVQSADSNGYRLDKGAVEIAALVLVPPPDIVVTPQPATALTGVVAPTISISALVITPQPATALTGVGHPIVTGGLVSAIGKTIVPTFQKLAYISEGVDKIAYSKSRLRKVSSSSLVEKI